MVSTAKQIADGAFSRDYFKLQNELFQQEWIQNLNPELRILVTNADMLSKLSQVVRYGSGTDVTKAKKILSVLVNNAAVSTLSGNESEMVSQYLEKISDSEDPNVKVVINKFLANVYNEYKENGNTFNSVKDWDKVFRAFNDNVINQVKSNPMWAGDINRMTLNFFTSGQLEGLLDREGYDPKAHKIVVNSDGTVRFDTKEGFKQPDQGVMNRSGGQFGLGNPPSLSSDIAELNAGVGSILNRAIKIGSNLQGYKQDEYANYILGQRGLVAPTQGEPTPQQQAEPQPQVNPQQEPQANNLQGYMGELESQYNIPSGYLSDLSTLESNNDATARSPTGATGLFQFTGSTAKQYGLTDRTDPVASTEAAAKLTSDNMKYLESAGIDPNPFHLRMAHMLGAGGFRDLVSAIKEGRDVSPKTRRNMDIQGENFRGLPPSEYYKAFWNRFSKKTGRTVVRN